MTKAISWLLVAGAGSWLTLAASQLAAQQPTARTSSAPRAPDKDYLVLVASEGNDRISLVRFGPAGASVEHVSRIGRNPTEPVGPHGLGVSPDGRYYYVSTAHGFPNGDLWKFTTAGDSLKGRVTLGLFPARVEEWCGLEFPESGNYVVEGALVPVEIDRERDYGAYREPNVWMRHPRG